MFYMATRYAGNGSEPNLYLTNTPPNASPWGTEMGDLDAFLDWNRLFGPDAAEVRRNNRIFSALQGNPFDPAMQPPLHIEQVGDQLTVSFRKVRDAAIWGMTYTVQVSSDLITWVPGDGAVLSKIPEGAYWQKHVTIPAGVIQFVRVKFVLTFHF